MLLKGLIAGLLASLSGLGFLRFSVLLESYALLALGILLVLAGVMVSLNDRTATSSATNRRGPSLRR